MITHTDELGQTWTPNLVACVPVFLFEDGPLDPETGEASLTPLPGVRLDVCREAYQAAPGLAALWANPDLVLHHFGPGKRSLLADSWAEIFAAAPPSGGRWDIWRAVEPEELA